MVNTSLILDMQRKLYRWSVSDETKVFSDLFNLVCDRRTLNDAWLRLARNRGSLAADLEPWIAEASASLIASFAAGISKDKAEVAAAMTQPWSNGQTEGQITKLKLVKRQIVARRSG
jgi:transposase